MQHPTWLIKLLASTPDDDFEDESTWTPVNKNDGRDGAAVELEAA